MDSSRSPAAPARARRGPARLPAAALTAGAGAATATLLPGTPRAVPFVLELAALLAGAGAVLRARSASAHDARPHPTSPARPAGAANPQGPAKGANAPNAAAPPSLTKAASGANPANPQGPAIPGRPPDELRESTRRALVNLARRIQAAVNRQLRELREMEARHGADPDVFGELLRVDHATALIGRLADSLAVLGGDRPGRRWHRPIPVLGVLRGAMSRITEYRRVDLGPLPERVAVDGAAVEAVVHALAELLDNATRYSPPETRVTLTACQVPTGLAIEIEDAGVGLGREAAARAELMLATEDFGLELASLGDAPRLGLSVVGRLARAAGFEVSLHRGAGGGVRAVLLVPSALLRDQPPEPEPERSPGLLWGEGAVQPQRPDRPHSHRAAEPGPTAGGPTAPEAPASVTAHGLPKRRRRPPPGEPVREPRRREQRVAGGAGGAAAPGLWLGAFHAGLRGEGPGDDDNPRMNGARP